jgi:hypothetical protein
MTVPAETAEKLARLGETLDTSFYDGLDRQAILAEIRRREAQGPQAPRPRPAWGLSDGAVLARLGELGVTDSTLELLALTPLVAVAWADGKVDARERRAVLTAAKDQGLEEDGSGYALLERRLEQRPPEVLMESWVAYLEVIGELIGAEALARLRSDVLGRARQVAEASGGFLGLGSRISDEEQRLIDRLDRALR